MSTNYIDQITDTAGTTHDISEGDSTRIFRATCSTAASTAAKVATLDTSNKNFSLTAGVRVAVTFTTGNTATTPTLRVDGSSTGTAKTIAFLTAATSKTTGNGTTYNTWGAYETVIFTYDGTYWVNGGSGLGIYNAYNHDEKVAATQITNTSLEQYFIVMGTNTSNAETKYWDPSFQYVNSGTNGYMQIQLGGKRSNNDIRRGELYFYGPTINTGVLLRTAATTTSAQEILLPDASGTIALKSDVPSIRIVRW